MQTFKKEERLCSRKKIQELFNKGESFQIIPFRVIWLDTKLDSRFPAQVLISVPKRNIKKATERNSVKRLIREVYRKNKQMLYSCLNPIKKQCILMIIYNGYQILTYQEFEAKIILILQQLTEIYEKRSG